MPIQTPIATRVINPNASSVGQNNIINTSSLDGDLSATLYNSGIGNITSVNDPNIGSAMQIVSYDGGQGYAAYATYVDFFKTRSTSNTGDANTILNAGDQIANLRFFGANGSVYKKCAEIHCTLNGADTPSATSMPGLLDFLVSLPATTSPISFLQIDSHYGFNLYRTNTAGGTTGAQTINKPSGSVNFAAGASSLVVTNSMVSATSNILCTVATNDATATLKNCVPGAGSFTITLTAAATAETRVVFFVTN